MWDVCAWAACVWMQLIARITYLIAKTDFVFDRELVLRIGVDLKIPMSNEISMKIVCVRAFMWMSVL
jgi:hypothetical protein